MKKNLRHIIFWEILFISIICFISFVLGIYHYQFLNWVKFVTIMISMIGIILGTIQLLRKRKVFCMLEFMIMGVMGLGILFYYSCNKEEIVVKNNRKMIKETHLFLLSNWIKYYDYKNIFIRKKQERIYEAHDDVIGEYLYTIYFDEYGNVIQEEK